MNDPAFFFYNFSPEGGCSGGLDAFRFFSKHDPRVTPRYDMLRASVVLEFCLDASVCPSRIELSPEQRTVSEYSSTEVWVRRLNLRRLTVVKTILADELTAFSGSPTSIETAHISKIYQSDRIIARATYCIVSEYSSTVKKYGYGE